MQHGLLMINVQGPQMYVSVAKRKVLECLELPAATAALLTSNDKETNLHAVPLWSVTLKSMARLLKHYRGHYTTVVGFQPTGWTQKQGVCSISPGCALMPVS